MNCNKCNNCGGHTKTEPNLSALNFSLRSTSGSKAQSTASTQSSNIFRLDGKRSFLQTQGANDSFRNANNTPIDGKQNYQKMKLQQFMNSAVSEPSQNDTLDTSSIASKTRPFRSKANNFNINQIFSPLEKPNKKNCDCWAIIERLNLKIADLHNQLEAAQNPFKNALNSPESSSVTGSLRSANQMLKDQNYQLTQKIQDLEEQIFQNKLTGKEVNFWKSKYEELAVDKVRQSALDLDESRRSSINEANDAKYRDLSDRLKQKEAEASDVTLKLRISSQTLNETQAENQRLKNALDEASKKFDNLKKEYDSYKKDSEQALAQKDKQIKQITQQGQSGMQQLTDDLQRQIKDYEQRVKENESKIRNLLDQIRDSEIRMKALTDQNQELDGRYRLLTDDNKSLKTQLDKSKASQLTQTQAQEYEDEIEKLRKQIKQLEEKMETSTSSETTMAEVETWRRKFIDANKLYHQLQEKVQLLEAENHSLQTSLQGMQTRSLSRVVNTLRESTSNRDSGAKDLTTRESIASRLSQTQIVKPLE